MLNQSKSMPKATQKNVLARKILVDSEIAKRGYSYADLAVIINTTPTVLTDVVSGRRRSRRVVDGICRLLNFSVDIVFPEYQKGEHLQA